MIPNCFGIPFPGYIQLVYNAPESSGYEIRLQLELLVLDSLANDTECVASIWPDLKAEIPNISGRRVKDTLFSLYQRGLVYISGEAEPVTHEEILAEKTTDKYLVGNYYFGLTSAGAEFWEESCREIGDPIDWSDSWVIRYHAERNEGYVDGMSRTICLKALNMVEDRQVDMDSLVDSEIEGFQAKYYKFLSGGHRIWFTYTK